MKSISTEVRDAILLYVNSGMDMPLREFLTKLGIDTTNYSNLLLDTSAFLLKSLNDNIAVHTPDIVLRMYDVDNTIKYMTQTYTLGMLND